MEENVTFLADPTGLISVVELLTVIFHCARGVVVEKEAVLSQARAS